MKQNQYNTRRAFAVLAGVFLTLLIGMPGASVCAPEVLLVADDYPTIQDAVSNPAPPTRNLQPSYRRCLCDQVYAQNIGKILYQASPLNELDESRWRHFASSIESNAQLLTAGSPTIACARNLGRALINQGIRSFAQQDYDNAYGNVLAQGGNMEQAQGVANSMMSGSLDALMTGQELLWLSEVLPLASQGNWQQYLTTGTQSRLQIRQVIQIYRMMPGMVDSLREAQPILDQFGPMATDQMVMASCLFAR